MLLEQINQVNDIKKLNKEDWEPLAQEIRDFLIEKISVTGGHLASNLGVVELTMAMHLAFNFPEDQVVWDVGHQSYTHKLLTGRRAGFDDLRKYGGMSGFPKRKESNCDCFDTGHSSTSISAGIGLVKARELTGGHQSVISVIGDGSMTGGMAFEALNNASQLKSNFIIILNDNQMSIAENVGGLSQYLNGMRSNEGYNNFKAGLQNTLEKIPVYGDGIVRQLKKTKSGLKQLVIPGMFFEDMGITYLGPVDGHNIDQLIRTFNDAKKVHHAVLIHVCTKKGKGYEPAERHPSRFHGAEPFVIETGLPKNRRSKANYTDIFSTVMRKLGDRDERVVAITAAMPDGTGLKRFKNMFPDRFFDVGIAEQHAVTFAAGLASQGMLPVVAIYSTFFQRAYDQMIHDVNLMHLDVLFAVDRAGLVPGDGETHQGIYDTGYFSQIGIPVYSPCNYAELEYWLEALVKTMRGPRAIRYARGEEKPALAALGCTGKPYDMLCGADKADTVLVSYGAETEEILAAAELLRHQGMAADCCKLVQVYPLPDGLCRQLSNYKTILFAEESVATGGIGQQLCTALQAAGWQGRFILRGVDNTHLLHATVPQLRRDQGLDAHTLAQDVLTRN